jgi:hypothetical protein
MTGGHREYARGSQRPRSASGARLAAVLLLAGCAPQEGAVLRGALAERTGCGEADLQLVAGEADTVRVRSCRFSLRVPADSAGSTAELRFLREGQAAARMRVEGLVPGVRVHLHEVWFDGDGRAFPLALELWGVPLLTVNGLRMSGEGAGRGALATEGEVLALESGRGTLLVRPDGDSLPDLYVRMDTTAEIVDTRGEPATLARLSPGAPVSLAGVRERTHLRAERLVVPAPPRPPPPPPAPPAEDRRPNVWQEFGRVWEEIERAVTGRGQDEASDRDRRRQEEQVERQRGRQEEEARRAREAMEREQRRLEERLERERRRRGGAGPPR